MAKIEKPLLGAKHDPRWQRSDVQALLERIGRYTRFVSLSKLVLGSGSLLLIGTIVVMPLLNADKEGIRLAFSGVQEDGANGSLPVMTNPTFQGVDGDNQPYYVTADRAVQLDAQRIRLDQVQGDMLSENNAWLSVKSQKGLLNNQLKQMQLLQDVRLMHQDGYEFRTQSVQIDMAAKLASGSEKIAGFGPMGHIEADGFEWQHDQQVLRFTGNVRVKVVNPHGV